MAFKSIWPDWSVAICGFIGFLASVPGVWIPPAEGRGYGVKISMLDPYTQAFDNITIALTLFARRAFASAIFFCIASTCGISCEPGPGEREPLVAREGVGDAEDDDAAAGEGACSGFLNFASLASTSARLAAISAAVYNI